MRRDRLPERKRADFGVLAAARPFGIGHQHFIIRFALPAKRIELVGRKGQQFTEARNLAAPVGRQPPVQVFDRQHVVVGQDSPRFGGAGGRNGQRKRQRQRNPVLVGPLRHVEVVGIRQLALGREPAAENPVLVDCGLRPEPMRRSEIEMSPVDAEIVAAAQERLLVRRPETQKLERIVMVAAPDDLVAGPVHAGFAAAVEIDFAAVRAAVGRIDAKDQIGERPGQHLEPMRQRRGQEGDRETDSLPFEGVDGPGRQHPA